MAKDWGQRAATAVGLVMFGGAVWFLQRELRKVSLGDVLDSIAATPITHLLLASGLSVAGYAVLIGYDLLGLRYIGRRLPLRRVVLAGYISGAFSNTVSLPVLGVAGMRYRFYRAWGLGNGEIARLIAIVGLSSWAGLLALSGGTFVVHPPDLPFVAGASDPWIRLLGGLFLAAVAGYLLVCGWRRSVRLWKWDLAVPSRRVAVGQVLVGAGDWIAQALVVYTLLRSFEGVSMGWFLPIYLSAMLVAMIGNTGLGVFEAGALLLLTPTVDRDRLVGVLILYRMIYHVLPLLIAMAIFAGYEVRQRTRKRAKRSAQEQTPAIGSSS